MSHDDLFRERRRAQETVPDWVVDLLEAQALVLRELKRMKQTTTDLVNVTNALIENSANVDAAIDGLVEAQAADDSTAVAEAISKLQGLKADQDTHLGKLAAVVPPVVAAPADPAPVAITPPAA